jgi:hypothetical protein
MQNPVPITPGALANLHSVSYVLAKFEAELDERRG